MAELAHLRALAKRYPDVPSVLVEQANLEAILTLPKMTVHVVSDVHGEHVKLRQVINNASGSLRPFLEKLFAGQLSAAEITELLKLLYYPRETWFAIGGTDEVALRFCDRALVIIRALAQRYTLKHVERIIPDPFDPIVRELMFGGPLARSPTYVAAMLKPFLDGRRPALELVRMFAHIVRNLQVGELVVAGDLGDRGPRIDKVIELLEQQPNVSITFGNHDADWIAAALGHLPAIATVVRLSLRYQRLAQLEEGYGISLAPLGELARTIYKDDPATCFGVKGEAADPLALARMQKAIAIIQFKLEGALFQRHPEWQLEQRALLHRIDPKAGSVEIEGKRYPLRDTAFPTIDWRDPYALSAAEQTCITALQQSFLGSSTLWRQISFVASHGTMVLRRDRCAIFHGCVPVDAAGNFQALVVDGQPRAGKALFDALDIVMQRAVRKRADADLDLVFYLWTGPLSPLFGKDKMATFETYFVEDKATQEEHKNAYFKLIHDKAFCAKVLREFGVADDGFLINGHVPVKLEQGEQPIKKSGHAITIDGAFAAAYGDKGFSLVLDARRMYLARHHHFDGAEAAVAQGDDIVPTVSDVEVYPAIRLVADTEKGEELRAEIAALDELVHAFEINAIRGG